MGKRSPNIFRPLGVIDVDIASKPNPWGEREQVEFWEIEKWVKFGGISPHVGVGHRFKAMYHKFELFMYYMAQEARKYCLRCPLYSFSHFVLACRRNFLEIIKFQLVLLFIRGGAGWQNCDFHIPLRSRHLGAPNGITWIKLFSFLSSLPKTTVTSPSFWHFCLWPIPQ